MANESSLPPLNQDPVPVALAAAQKQESVLSRILRHIFTGDDDQTYEVANVLFGFGFFVGVLLEIVDFGLQWFTGKEGSFNFLAYMTGLSTGVMALTTGLKIRDYKPRGEGDHHE